MSLQCSQPALYRSQTIQPVNAQKPHLGRDSIKWAFDVALTNNQMKLLQREQLWCKKGFGVAVKNVNFKINPKNICKTMASASMPMIRPSTIHVASFLFTLGTAFVVPFYTVMIFVPHAQWTRKFVESNIPYVFLGILYLYLLSLSWTPGTLRLMFASKYLLPELPGITKMFSSTLTVASAWIHLLAVDLFAGRQVFLDGLEHAVETRHSLVLCLLFCPIGILSHFITKVATLLMRRETSKEVADVSTLFP